MRTNIIIAATALALASATLPLSAPAQSALVNGEVTKVDAAAEKITIRHGPLKKFDMQDSMTMVFRVSDPAMLKAVKAGDKVKFDVDRVNGQFTVTKIEKAR
jgi:Cu(I)/Ag(I) efflux system protein CusF